MLPFLKLNNQSASSGVMQKMRKPDEKPIDEDNIGNESDDEMAQKAIESCAKDLIQAVHSQNIKAAASAIQSAFVILDSMPHAEGPHTEEGDNSFKAQNVRAAMED